MLRTGRYKLLVRGTLEDGMLFDLEKDPWELENRFRNPAYREVLEQLKEYLVNTMLFGASGKNHCDPSAPRTVEQSVMDGRAGRLKAFIRKRW